ncbi:unnamed protein product, partial [Phaeothamnion confervicola]
MRRPGRDPKRRLLDRIACSCCVCCVAIVLFCLQLRGFRTIINEKGPHETPSDAGVPGVEQRGSSDDADGFFGNDGPPGDGPPGPMPDLIAQENATTSTSYPVLFPNIAHAYLDPDRHHSSRAATVAYAVTVTRDDAAGPYLDGAAVLAQSIDEVCGAPTARYSCDLVAFVTLEVIAARPALAALGFRVLERPLPVPLVEVRDAATRAKLEKGGCCGAAELLKLYSYTLTEYAWVVHLDTDVLLLSSLDDLIFREGSGGENGGKNGSSGVSLLYTVDVNMWNPKFPVKPVQGGFLVVRPDPTVFAGLQDVLRTVRYEGGTGWGGTHVGLHWGGINVQGILPYYYSQQAPDAWRDLDRCVYNSMADSPECKAVPMERIVSAHFTACQKPWLCVPRFQNDLCREMHAAWFERRQRLQRRLEERRLRLVRSAAEEMATGEVAAAEAVATDAAAADAAA